MSDFVVIKDILSRAYQKAFGESWSLWFSGLLLAILSILSFAWARPWGVAGGLRNFGDWIFYGLGIYEKQILEPWFSTNFMVVFGILLGSFVSALLAKQFSFRMAPRFELIKGVVGGSLMGIGAAFAGGCNIGGFYLALSSLSLSGTFMMMGLLAGAYLGLKYLYWELEFISGGGAVKQDSPDGFDWKQTQPWFGALFLLLIILAAWLYSEDAYTRIGLVLLFGTAIGIVFQRSRLCFVRVFRCPFMTGDSKIAGVAVMSILITMLGYTALKWNGFRGEEVYVANAFWLGALGGGLIFGFGMILAGGCGSGSVFRAGEGHVKLIIAVFFFSLTTSLTKHWIKSSDAIQEWVGTSFYLPHYFSYLVSIFIVSAILLLYYLFTLWNEETGKCIVDP